MYEKVLEEFASTGFVINNVKVDAEALNCIHYRSIFNTIIEGNIIVFWFFYLAACLKAFDGSFPLYLIRIIVFSEACGLSLLWPLMSCMEVIEM